MAEHCYDKRWSDMETMLLLKIWKNHLPDFQVRKPPEIYLKMSSELEKCGILKNSLQVAAKVNYFTQKYKKTAANSATTSKWKYYTKVQRILGTSVLSSEPAVFNKSSETSGSRGSRRNAKRRLNNYQQMGESTNSHTPEDNIEFSSLQQIDKSANLETHDIDSRFNKKLISESAFSKVPEVNNKLDKQLTMESANSGTHDVDSRFDKELTIESANSGTHDVNSRFDKQLTTESTNSETHDVDNRFNKRLTRKSVNIWTRVVKNKLNGQQKDESTNYESKGTHEIITLDSSDSSQNVRQNIYSDTDESLTSENETADEQFTADNSQEEEQQSDEARSSEDEAASEANGSQEQNLLTNDPETWALKLKRFLEMQERSIQSSENYKRKKLQLLQTQINLQQAQLDLQKKALSLQERMVVALEKRRLN